MHKQKVKLKIPQLTLRDIAQMGRHWDGKHFAEINLPFTTKQYKNDNTANFV